MFFYNFFSHIDLSKGVSHKNNDDDCFQISALTKQSLTFILFSFTWPSYEDAQKRHSFVDPLRVLKTFKLKSNLSIKIKGFRSLSLLFKLDHLFSLWITVLLKKVNVHCLIAAFLSKHFQKSLILA